MPERRSRLCPSHKLHYNCTYMGQITIYLDDDTERLVKRHVKGSKESASKWIAEAVRRGALAERPADLLALFGSWKDDAFPAGAGLRNNPGAHSPGGEI